MIVARLLPGPLPVQVESASHLSLFMQTTPSRSRYAKRINIPALSTVDRCSFTSTLSVPYEYSVIMTKFNTGPAYMMIIRYTST